MALTLVPDVLADTQPTYSGFKRIDETSYSVPSGHYALIKLISSGTSPTDGQQYFINGDRCDIFGEMTISSGIRIPAGTVIYTSMNNGPYLILEIWKL